MNWKFKPEAKWIVHTTHTHTHTQSLWWIGSQVENQMKRPNEKVMSKVVKLQRKSVNRYDQKIRKPIYTHTVEDKRS